MLKAMRIRQASRMESAGWKCRTIFLNDMSTQERLIQAIRNQPEPVLRELWHYLRFLERQHQEDEWADVLPGREVEQEVLDILDNHAPTAQ